MTADRAQLVSKIALERPASVRRHLPLASDQGWMLPDYLVGPENETLRYLFDDANIRQLGKLSPVVLYGDKNVGKTALSITLAVRWSRLLSLRPLSFSSAQAFAVDYAAAVEIDDVDSFRKRHRECRLLVIDDLEEMSRAPAAQLELVNTLDILAEADHPVVITVSRLPSTIRGLSPALASRLAGGFSVSLQRPGPATRDAIVRALAEHLEPQLPIDELVAFCAEFSSKPLMANDLHRLVLLAAQNHTNSQTVDFDMLSQLAVQLLAGESPTIAGIAKLVARKMHVRLSEMRGATREANIVRARGLAIYLTRKLTPTSLQQIGEFFGGRDHSTVIHAYRKIEQRLDSDAELATLLSEIQADLLC